MSDRPFGHVMRRRSKGKDGTYRRHPYYWVSYPNPDPGRDGPIRFSTGSQSKREAERILLREEEALRNGTWVHPNVRKKRERRTVTMGDLAELFIRSYKREGCRSLKRAETSKKVLLEHFGKEEPAPRITTARIMTYIEARQDTGVANATIRNELMALSKMFRLAVEQELIPKKPKIPPIRVDNARRGFFEEVDFRAVVEGLPDYLKPAIEFCYYTGWRIRSEVLLLHWSQVDFRVKTVRLEPGTTKNGRGRTFPFGAYPQLEELLTAQRQRARFLDTDWVFFHTDGRPIKSYRRAWAKACKTSERPGRLVHDLRRTAVRNLVRAGVPDKVAMTLTGHETRAVFDRYNIVNEADLNSAVTRLAAFHAGLQEDGSDTFQTHEANGQA